jgi:peptidyl-prolyl cis-trans isomerase B (cyclophilin B)
MNREARLEYEQALARRRRTMRAARILVPIAVIVVAVLVVTSGGGDDEGTAGVKRTFASAPPMTIDPTATYTATLETTKGTIVIALDAANAPTSVNNFVFLADKKFYDGLTFHRAATDFVIQGGDPKGDGSGGPGYTVQAELPTSPYAIGAVAWAKTGAEPPGTGASQFFIGTGATITTLPLEYGIIGQVTTGLDVAQQIGAFAPESGDGPLTQSVRIKKVTIAKSAPTSTTSSTPAP